jgi:hypothetical protein
MVISLSLVFFTVTADAADVRKSRAAQEDAINLLVIIFLLCGSTQLVTSYGQCAPRGIVPKYFWIYALVNAETRKAQFGGRALDNNAVWLLHFGDG